MAGSSIWSDLPRRATVLLIGIPFAGWVLSEPFVTWAVLQMLHLVAAWEWLGMMPRKVKNEEVPPKKSWTVYLFPIFSVAVSNSGDSFLMGVVAVACFYSLMETIDSTVVVGSPHLLKGLLFWTTPLHVWNSLSQDFGATTFLLAVAWNCDSGALIVGRLSKSLLGETRIPPPTWLQRISPAKSVEGMLGGIAAGCWTSAAWPFLYSWLIFFMETIIVQDTASSRIGTSMALEGMSLTERMVLGLGLSLLAITGDLWESSTKRQAGVKDSGKLLPGHGGLLDRFDSALLPGVFYSWYFWS